MKVVRKIYTDIDTDYIVSNDIVKSGVWFGENEHILLDDERVKDIYTKWLDLKEDDENDLYDDERINFCSYLDGYYSDIDYKSLKDEEHYSEEELEELSKKYKYAIDGYIGAEVISSEEFFDGFEKDLYIEYWDGHNWVQHEVEIIHDSDEVKRVESNLDYYVQRKTGQYDLYKIGGNLALIYNSYFQGSLSYIDEYDISNEELEERFGYKLEEE